MTGRTLLAASVAAAILIGLSACATRKTQLMKLDASQLDLRNMQTRAFDSTDETKALRSVISTLQDLDYLIHDANKVLGLVSATKSRLYERSSSLHSSISVSVRRKGETQLLVRVNAAYAIQGPTDEEPQGITVVRNASFYQRFFTQLEKSMFLTAHEVD